MLLLQLVNDEREHVHFALARCVLGKADSREAIGAPANSEWLAIKLDIFPAKREPFVWPQAAEDEDGDDRAILASRRIDKPPRLFQRERIKFALRFAQVLHEDRRVFADQFTAFRDREDRSQTRNHHIDSPRSDQLVV